MLITLFSCTDNFVENFKFLKNLYKHFQNILRFLKKISFDF